VKPWGSEPWDSAAVPIVSIEGRLGTPQTLDAGAAFLAFDPALA
jgi:hypothetical protein